MGNWTVKGSVTYIFSQLWFCTCTFQKCIRQLPLITYHSKL